MSLPAYSPARPGRSAASTYGRPLSVGRGAAAPTLQLVRGPAVSRPVGPYLLLLISIIFGAMAFCLMLNTQMAVTSYKIHDTRAHLVELKETQQTLKTEVEQLGSPEYLRQAAEEIGMAPPHTTHIMNLEHGTITEVPGAAGQ